MRLTKAKIDEYIKNRGRFCPYCDANAIELKNEDYAVAQYSVTVQCRSCMRVWFDVYKLSTIIEDKSVALNKT